MITSSLINLVTFLLKSLIAVFPSGGGLPSSFHTASITLGGYLALISPLVPLTVLFTCIALLITVQLALYGFRFFRWLLSYLPFIGGTA